MDVPGWFLGLSTNGFAGTDHFTLLRGPNGIFYEIIINLDLAYVRNGDMYLKFTA